METYKYADEQQRKLHTKFPNAHFLCDPNNVDHTLLWNTFFRRNLHRLAIDYLGIKLHIYQAIMLYFMGISQFIVTIASRSAAKSFIIALYACCRCITRPNTQFIIASAVLKQSRLIISEKIKKELMSMSPALKREILDIKDNLSESIVYFKNGSFIRVVPASENARGNRSNCCLREEFRQIDKNIDDSVLSPCQIVRQTPYLLVEPYSSIKELREDPVDIYISSSWLDNGHWMWGIVDTAFSGLMEENGACLLAFDESVVLKHNIKTMTQLQKEKTKQDPLTWRIEFLNERVKENSAAFYSYEMLLRNQNCKKPFYPRQTLVARDKKKNPYAIPKQQGELRIISCDMAFIQNRKNDNSIFSCIRLLPESVVYETQSNNNGQVRINQGYRRILPYLEHHQGGDTGQQAIRIRQLYEDFDADYIVLDTRNGGIAVYDLLAKVMYDEERDCEYSPLKAMNNDEFANRIKISGAKACIFVINATAQLNSVIAQSFRDVLVRNKIDFLVPLREAKDSILQNIKGYSEDTDAVEQLFYEAPFLETQLLISETTELVYEKKEQSGIITVHEQNGKTKDRYTSVSYGSYFASLLEKDLLSEEPQVAPPNCVSNIDF